MLVVKVKMTPYVIKILICDLLVCSGIRLIFLETLGVT